MHAEFRKHGQPGHGQQKIARNTREKPLQHLIQAMRARKHPADIIFRPAGDPVTGNKNGDRTQDMQRTGNEKGQKMPEIGPKSSYAAIYQRTGQCA